MLTVSQIKPSSIEKGYHLEQDGGYYIEAPTAKALYTWYGKGADKLGLKGSVNLSDYKAVFNGHLPNKTAGTIQTPPAIKTRPGYDLTFSLNKDISLMICCSQDKALSDYFLKAHHHAVKTVLSEIEKKAQARVTQNGITEYVNTGNLIVALCTHLSSRAGDPQVHTHACVANRTERPDGQWRALATDMSRQAGFYEMLRDNARYFGMLYQNEMAYATQQKGFTIQKRGQWGLFEIQGIPENLRQHFSKRHEAIAKIVTEKYGESALNNKGLVAKVAEHSRAHKEPGTLTDFLSQSQKAMQTFIEDRENDLSAKSFATLLDKAREPHPLKTTSYAREAICDAIDTLSQFRTTLEASTVINQALELDLGNSTFSQLVAAFNEQVQKQKIFVTASGRYVSKKLIDTENALLGLIANEANERAQKETINIDTVSAFKKQLNRVTDQSRFCILQEPSRLALKKTMLLDLITSLEAQDKKVKVLTVNTTMAEQMNTLVQSKQQSIWQRLLQLGREDLGQSMGSFIYHYEKELTFLLNNLLTRAGKEVFVVDEAHRLSFPALEKLVTLTQQRQAKLIFLEHKAGRQSVFAGNAMRLLREAGVQTLALSNYEKGVSQSKQPDHQTTPKTNFQWQGVTCESHQKAQVEQARFNACLKQLNAMADLNNLLFVTTSKASQARFTQSIREHLLALNELDKAQHTQSVSAPFFIAHPKAKQAKFYPVGLVIKTYVGRGAYQTERVLNRDLNNNRIMLQDEQGKGRAVPASVLGKSIHEETKALSLPKELSLRVGDRLHLVKTNQLAEQCGLKQDHTYSVQAINEKKLILAFCSDKGNTQSIKLNRKDVQALFLDYDYVKTFNQLNLNQSYPKIVYEFSSVYGLNNKISELSRLTTHLVLVSENIEKAKKMCASDATQSLARQQVLTEPATPSQPAEQALDYGIRVVGAKEAAFSKADLLKKSMEFDLGAFDKDTLINTAQEKLKSSTLLAGPRLKNKPILLTTPKARETETQILDQIRAGKGVLPALTRPHQVDEFFSKMAQTPSVRALNAGQQAACRLIATTTDQFVMIQGFAGTGKSTMLETLLFETFVGACLTQKQSASSRKPLRLLPETTKVMALAPTHRAVHELAEKGVKGQTLKQFLVDHTPLTQASLIESLKDSLVLVDESSMISNQDFLALQSIIQKGQARCVYLGDMAQLNAVEAGSPSKLCFYAEKAQMATIIMHEIIRQKTPDLKGVVERMITKPDGDQNFKQALEKLDAMGCIRESSQESPIQQLAQDYCALPKAERAQSCVSVATNRDRNALNQAIRQRLVAQGEVTSSISLQTAKLVDSRLSAEELRFAHNYPDSEAGRRPCIVRYNQDYFQLVDKDLATNTLVLRDDKGKQNALPLSSLPKETTLALYYQEPIVYAKGDQLKFTKTDRNQAQLANTPLTVAEVMPETHQLIVKEKSGKTHTILMHEMAGQHLDYNYASTVHGQQGRTAKTSFLALNTTNRNANTRRLLYVGVSRATHQCVIYTDSKAKLLQQIIKTPHEKTSALEALGEFKKVQKALNHTPKDVLAASLSQSFQTKQAEKKRTFIDKERVEKSLKQRAESIVFALLGEPNRALSNSSNWRYGRKGSLSVWVSGERAGLFHHFETGDKGGLIQLIQREYQVNFMEALEVATRLLGSEMSKAMHTKAPNSPIQLPKEKAKEATQKQQYIHQMIAKSRPLEGTVAALYLKKRGIHLTEKTGLRCLTHTKTGAGNAPIKPFSAALLAISRDQNGQPKAIQLTYLDKQTAQKLPNLPVQKRTIGNLSHSVVNLSPEVKSPQITYVTEGVETGLSVREALQNQKSIQVMATLGKHNMSKVPLKNIADRVVLVLDNDLKPIENDLTLRQAEHHFRGNNKQVKCVIPEPLNGKKTDYNDLAKAGKSSDIERQLVAVAEQFEKEKTPNQKPNSLDKHVEMEI